MPYKDLKMAHTLPLRTVFFFFTVHLSQKTTDNKIKKSFDKSPNVGLKVQFGLI